MEELSLTQTPNFIPPLRAPNILAQQVWQLRGAAGFSRLQLE